MRSVRIGTSLEDARRKNKTSVLHAILKQQLRS